MQASRFNPWIAYPSANRQARLRLFCFPYAGASAAIFRGWANNLPSSVNVCPVQLPGRGSRINEAPFTNLMQLAEAAARALEPLLDMPFAFFGHSMDAALAFEASRRLLMDNCPQPRRLFVSACRAPHFFDTTRVIYNLPDAEFIKELRKLRGTPDEVLKHPELMQLMMPVLRADFQASQSYQYLAGPPLECAITAFGGSRDEEVNREHLNGWREYTRNSFHLRMFPDDHFFLHENETDLLSSLSQELNGLEG